MSEIELKRKVTLKSKINEKPDPPKKSKWWIWVLLLVVVGVVIFICVRNCSSNSNNDTTTETEISATADQPAESVTDTTGEIDGTDVTNTEATPEESSTSDKATTETDPVATSGKATATNDETVPVTKTKPDRKSETGNNQNVNSTPVSTPLPSGIDEKAMQAIRGDFGNGIERKQKLGNEYEAIQKRVNEIYREQNLN